MFCVRRGSFVDLPACLPAPSLGASITHSTPSISPYYIYGTYRANQHAFGGLQEATTMEDGTVLEKNTGVIVLTRYAGASENCFTRAKDFVPER